MTLAIKILQTLIKIRYNINIKGLENLSEKTPTLIFPSHVALMDPVIIYAFLRTKWKICPIVWEEYYNKPILKQIFKRIWAISVVDLEKNEQDKLETNQLMSNIIDSLNEWKKILLYPQWAMARQGFQSIIGKKTAYYCIQQATDNTKIVTINIKWLWGSRSSWWRDWEKPSISEFIRKWIRFTIANLFFFVPKRNVEIIIKDSTQKLQKAAKLWINSFNQELEKIYNAKWEEKLEYLSWLSWLNTTKNHKEPKKIIWSISELHKTNFDSSIQIPDNILKEIIQIIKKIKPDIKWKMTPNTNLILDCFFDSLDMSEVKSCVQSRFSNSSNPPLLDLKTIWDVAVMAMGKSASNEELKPCERNFKNDKKLIYSHFKPIINSESTILSVMKDSFKDNLSESLCYDQIFGVQTKKDFLIKAYLISNLLKKISGERIAIMLPSLSATALLVTGCYLANKIPVMLNWTLSKEAFSHCLKSQKIETILTSKSFFDKIQRPRIKNYKMTFFEEMLKNISLFQKLQAVSQAKKFKIPQDISPIAVVLFTSWSEALPKSVELTHQNLLQDLFGAAGIVSITRNDIEIWFLPPFHSFGFTLWIVLPLTSGIRIVYTPDPNDSANITKIIGHSKATFLASTPTFLKKIVQSTKWNQLSSLRIAIVWAEKCPKELFTKFSQLAPKSTILEWYGITECSPIITVNPLKTNAKIKKWTTGKPILGEKVKIINLDTWTEQPINQEWMICVKWMNIFEWYVDKTIDSPFIEINWEQWYKTWDLGYIDKDGYLSISGRLKRFVKIAWEMISLPAIETVLSRKWQSSDWTESIAIEALEKKNGTVEFTIFTTNNISLDEINSYIHEEWISNLVHIDHIIQLDEIPMLWTGKIDHVSLKKLLK